MACLLSVYKALTWLYSACPLLASRWVTLNWSAQLWWRARARAATRLGWAGPEQDTDTSHPGNAGPDTQHPVRGGQTPGASPQVVTSIRWQYTSVLLLQAAALQCPKYECCIMTELLRSELMIFCHHDQSTEASVLVTRVVTPHICLSSPVNPLAWIMRCSTEEGSSRHFNIIHGVNIQLELYSQSSQHRPMILPKASSFSGNWWCCSKRLQWLVKCVNYRYFVRCDV